ncbi:TonB-dependent receptor family protein [Marilutibacter alkalisoli]|uniref:TonB-dependent receptor n=1 Tax=Marilutibacter alkalisoli TaxID=2591633 RepID=A0A514BPF7_9GAMM|nr:TonB-dependent receptor [Lysobacter alkalisoli]QDH69277.1 TonB-dependent receptor [Lysobacter alkalisoli]
MDLCNRFPSRSLLALAIAACCGMAHAETAAGYDDQAVTLDHLTVVGSAGKAREAAGSAAYLDAETLEKHDYRDIQRVLRQVNGVYAIDEEGYGLRPNIGIRGSGTDRNSRITVLEDGVPIAPAVYAAPAAYYFPTASRMNAVEVRKGSATIRSGPRTTGGTINLISTPIPQQASGLVDFAYGTDQTVQAHAWAGGSTDNIGWLLETAQQQSDGFKRLDGGGDTGYTLEDYLGKFRINTGADARFYQSLELKLGKVEQDSDETYLGLTEADFDADPNRRYAASQKDNIKTDHEQVELRHYIAFSDSLDLTTVAYENEFSRNWYKLANTSAPYEWLIGGDSPDDALIVRNNNRSYVSKGVQSVLGWSLDLGGARHALEFGVRYHEDQEDRFQSDDLYRMDNGTMVLTTRKPAGSQDNRIGDAKAIAVYVQDEIRAGDWIVTPGLRYESIDLTRTDYAKQPDGRDLGPTRVRKSSVSEWMPGLGVTWLLSDNFNLFASAHKGFNPPGPGSDADPEESLNIETGLRWGRDSLQTELVGFWNDYSNLVGTCTESSGGGCVIGDQFDGGKARVRGIEASVAYDFGQANDWVVNVPVRLGYTWTEAEFRNSFQSGFEEWDTVTSGDKLPYLPEQALNVQVGVEGERWRVNLAGNYIDDMRTNAADTDPRTESAFVVDLAAGYRLTQQAELFARVENLTDETWIASRRPAGVRPGMPRQTYLGVRVKF